MAKNTGTGKVADNLKTPARSALTGLLFNFDIEGDAVKPEHQSWLTDNAIPLLACDQAVGSLTGLASRSGSASYNQQLSQRRVANVRSLLTAAGVQTDKLSALAVGENAAALAGVKDGTEEERDRAVAISIQMPARRGILRFTRENLVQSEDGFDTSKSPEWLMLPFGERRRLVLLNGSGMRLVTKRPGVVQFIDQKTNRPTNEIVATSSRHVVEFVAVTPGAAVIEARDLVTGLVAKVLDIDVLTPKRLKIALHFVTDPQHPNPSRSAASVIAMLREAQRIYKDQANVIVEAVNELPDVVRFTRNLSDPAAAPRNGQRPITPNTVGGDEFPDLLNRGNPAARVNIFYVWEWQVSANDTNGQADALGGRGVVFEDNTGDTDGTHEGFTFGHEIGHCLSLEHVDKNNLANKVRLMWRFTNEHEGKILREEVFKLRQSI